MTDYKWRRLVRELELYRALGDEEGMRRTVNWLRCLYWSRLDIRADRMLAASPVPDDPSSLYDGGTR